MRSPLPSVLVALSAISALLPTATAVFQDEAYQNDWHIPLLGASLSSSTFFARPVLDAKASLIYTLTEKSILAAVNPKDGGIVWRQKIGGEDVSIQPQPLPPGIARAGFGAVFVGRGGEVKSFDAVDGKLVWENEFSGVVRDVQIGSDVAVLFEDGSVRKLDGLSGNVIWEWKADGKDIAHSIAIDDSKAIIVLLQPSKKLNLVHLDLANGQLIDSAAIAASVESLSDITTSSSVLAWTEGSLKALKFTVLGSKGAVITTVKIPGGVLDVKIHISGEKALVHYHAAESSWIDVYEIKDLATKLYSLDTKTGSSSALSISESGYFTWSLPTGQFLYSLDSEVELAAYPVSLKTANTAILHAISEVVPRPDGKSYAVRTFVSTSTPGFKGNTHLIRNGELVWSRKESLASIVASTWVELLDPATELVAEELDVEGHKNFVGAYVHRVTRHIGELITYGPAWIKGIPGRVVKAFTSNDVDEGLGGKWVDFFGYRKYIVVATEEGGLAGIDVGKQGEIVWEFSISPVGGGWKGIAGVYEIAKGVVGVVTRSGEYIEVDAFEGSLLKLENIGYNVKSTTLVNTEVRKLVLAVLEGEKVVSLPFGHSLGETVVHLAIKDDGGRVKGLRVDASLVAKTTWAFTAPPSEEITSITTRPFHDPVASIGKVLGDRSVMYKYLSPHLLVITTIHPYDSTASVHLLDSVSGAVLYTATHTGVDTTKPVISTLSENWLVYTYYGDDDLTVGTETAAKGYHLVVSELFESEFKNDRGALNSAENFSSIDGGSGSPHVISQAYIFPSAISSLTVTSTRQGIAAHDILALLPSPTFSIVAIPKRALDPRRPIGRDPNESEREEGLFRYSPVMEIDPRSIINHQRELLGIHKVVTSPALLESTSLVFAYGCDLFGTRVTPSMAFDSLGKGFSKVQLLGTIVALGVGVGFVAPMVRRKQINQRWTGV